MRVNFSCITASILLFTLTYDALLARTVKKPITARVDYRQKLQPHPKNAFFLNFEENSSRDSSPQANHPNILGNARITPKGAFGSGLAFDGKDAALLIPKLRGMQYETGIALEFQVYFDTLPQKNACLMAISPAKGSSFFELQLRTDGKVQVVSSACETTAGKAPLLAGKWNHIAIIDYAKVNKFGKALGVGLQVLNNGEPNIQVLTHSQHFELSAYLQPQTLIFANDFKKSAPFRGRLDEIRICNQKLEYYKPYQQSFLRPEAQKPSLRKAPMLRESSLVQTSIPMNSSTAKTLEQVQRDDSETPSIDDIELHEESDLVKTKLIDGVVGKALVFDKMRHRMRLDTPLEFKRGGAIEFWVQPRNWDNFTGRPRKGSKVQFQDPYRHVLSLYEKGSPEPLLNLILTQFKDSGGGGIFNIKYGFTLQPMKWTHVVVTWGKGRRQKLPNLYVDGKPVPSRYFPDNRLHIDEERLAKAKCQFIEFGDQQATAIDELKFYTSPLLLEEALNTYALDTRGKPKPIPGAVCDYTYSYTRGDLKMNFWPSIRRTPDISRVELTLTNPISKKSHQGQFHEIKDGYAQASFNGLQRLPHGDYPIKGRYFTKDGKRIGEFDAVFKCKNLEWLDNRIGYSDKPPHPYLSLKRQKATLTLLDRQYNFNDQGFYNSMQSRDKELLHAPMNIKRTGAKADWQAAKIVSENANAISWQSEGRYNDLKIKVAAELEYDGMTKFTLELHPTQKQTRVEKLCLEIPIRNEFMKYIHALPAGGNFRSYEQTGLLPSKPGIVWDSMSFSKHSSVEKLSLGNFVNMVWLGGTIRGLCFFADNDKGWFPHDEHAAISLERKADHGVLRLNFISAETVIDKPRTIVFGWLATPSKPLPKNHRLWARGNTEKIGKIGGRLFSNDIFADWEMPIKKAAFDHFPYDYDWEYAKMSSDHQRTVHKGKYPKNAALFMYHDRKFIRSCREDEYFKWPNQSWPQEKVDCFVWYMNRFFTRGIYDGVYIDDFFPVASKDDYEGAAYRLPDGRLQHGNEIFAYREYLKRWYTLIDKQGKIPLITTHMTCTMNIALHSFVNYAYDGEQQGRFNNKQHSFIDAWPLDRLLTIDNPERTGLVTNFLVKKEYIDRDLPRSQWPQMVRKTQRSAWAMTYLFDFSGTVPTYPRLRKNWDDFFRDGNVEAYPFWRNSDRVEISDISHVDPKNIKLPIGYWRNQELKESLKTNPLRVSLYQHDKKLLVVVTNFLKSKVKAKVKLAWKNIGWNSKDKIHITDPDDWPDASGEDATSLKKPVNINEREISTQSEDDLDLDLALEEKKKVDDRAFKFKKDKGIEFTVRGHDFRLFELYQGTKPQASVITSSH